MDWTLISNTVELHHTVTPGPSEISVNAATPITTNAATPDQLQQMQAWK